MTIRQIYRSLSITSSYIPGYISNISLQHDNILSHNMISNIMGRPWCLQPESTVRKTHLENWTPVDEVPTPNLNSTRHLIIRMTQNILKSNLVKVNPPHVMAKHGSRRDSKPDAISTRLGPTSQLSPRKYLEQTSRHEHPFSHRELQGC